MPLSPGSSAARSFLSPLTLLPFSPRALLSSPILVAALRVSLWGVVGFVAALWPTARLLGLSKGGIRRSSSSAAVGGNKSIETITRTTGGGGGFFGSVGAGARRVRGRKHNNKSLIDATPVYSGPCLLRSDACLDAVGAWGPADSPKAHAGEASGFRRGVVFSSAMLALGLSLLLIASGDCVADGAYPRGLVGTIGEVSLNAASSDKADVGLPSEATPSPSHRSSQSAVNTDDEEDVATHPILEAAARVWGITAAIGARVWAAVAPPAATGRLALLGILFCAASLPASLGAVPLFASIYYPLGWRGAGVGAAVSAAALGALAAHAFQLGALRHLLEAAMGWWGGSGGGYSAEEGTAATPLGSNTSSPFSFASMPAASAASGFVEDGGGLPHPLLLHRTLIAAVAFSVPLFVAVFFCFPNNTSDADPTTAEGDSDGDGGNEVLGRGSASLFRNSSAAKTSTRSVRGGGGGDGCGDAAHASELSRLLPCGIQRTKKGLEHAVSDSDSDDENDAGNNGADEGTVLVANGAADGLSNSPFSPLFFVTAPFAPTRVRGRGRRRRAALQFPAADDSDLTSLPTQPLSRGYGAVNPFDGVAADEHRTLLPSSVEEEEEAGAVRSASASASALARGAFATLSSAAVAVLGASGSSPPSAAAAGQHPNTTVSSVKCVEVEMGVIELRPTGNNGGAVSGGNGGGEVFLAPPEEALAPSCGNVALDVAGQTAGDRSRSASVDRTTNSGGEYPFSEVDEAAAGASASLLGLGIGAARREAVDEGSEAKPANNRESLRNPVVSRGVFVLGDRAPLPLRSEGTDPLSADAPMGGGEEAALITRKSLCVMCAPASLFIVAAFAVALCGMAACLVVLGADVALSAVSPPVLISSTDDSVVALHFSQQYQQQQKQSLLAALLHAPLPVNAHAGHASRGGSGGGSEGDANTVLFPMVRLVGLFGDAVSVTLFAFAVGAAVAPLLFASRCCIGAGGARRRFLFRFLCVSVAFLLGLCGVLGFARLEAYGLEAGAAATVATAELASADRRHFAAADERLLHAPERAMAAASEKSSLTPPSSSASTLAPFPGSTTQLSSPVSPAPAVPVPAVAAEVGHDRLWGWAPSLMSWWGPAPSGSEEGSGESVVTRKRQRQNGSGVPPQGAAKQQVVPAGEAPPPALAKGRRAGATNSSRSGGGGRRDSKKKGDEARVDTASALAFAEAVRQFCGAVSSALLWAGALTGLFVGALVPLAAEELSRVFAARAVAKVAETDDANPPSDGDSMREMKGAKAAADAVGAAHCTCSGSECAAPMSHRRLALLLRFASGAALCLSAIVSAALCGTGASAAFVIASTFAPLPTAFLGSSVPFPITAAEKEESSAAPAKGGDSLGSFFRSLFDFDKNVSTQPPVFVSRLPTTPNKNIADTLAPSSAPPSSLPSPSSPFFAYLLTIIAAPLLCVAAALVLVLLVASACLLCERSRSKGTQHEKERRSTASSDGTYMYNTEGGNGSMHPYSYGLAAVRSHHSTAGGNYKSNGGGESTHLFPSGGQRRNGDFSAHYLSYGATNSRHHSHNHVITAPSSGMAAGYASLISNGHGKRLRSITFAHDSAPLYVRTSSSSSSTAAAAVTGGGGIGDTERGGNRGDAARDRLAARRAAAAAAAAEPTASGNSSDGEPRGPPPTVYAAGGGYDYHRREWAHFSSPQV